jgi:nicotinate-nucleotide pyrophosphorylase (carboxylating)
MADWNSFIQQALREDIGTGDYTTLSIIPENKIGKARLLVKGKGVIAGIELAGLIFNRINSSIKIEYYMRDGDLVNKGDVPFVVNGMDRSILMGERLVLNCMQRMSGIATMTKKFVNAVEGTGVKILDTRKTTPLFRAVEKWAVRIGGGHNHRFGLYDMVLIKDNHIDYAGGIGNAIDAVQNYFLKNKLTLPVEIETRNLEEVKQVIMRGDIDRVMLDNFPVDEIHEAVRLIAKKFVIEISGGITLENVRQYAETGVDYISVGALTHSYQSLDMSLKAIA